MHRTAPRLTRRSLALAAPFLAVAQGAVSQGAVAQSAVAQAPATPPQTLGPFYPLDWAGDVDGDLVRVAGQDARAQGIVTHLRGQLRDTTGVVIPGAGIEIWQCDAMGRYLHPRDRGPRDAGFQGRGRVITGADGGFAFRTIRPVAYPGRTPHIHVAVVQQGGSRALVSQFYVSGEASNERDGIFRALGGAAAREAVLLHLRPADTIEPGALLAVRDIVLG